ncbi:DICT sensory domain-containing protein [Halorussus sp. MSC15.2]|uniref:DICT sensory domain-containing protein n=1 Tax=Halorussus sp. MSC15.2 TaxID=2283638 RepID=UPI0013D0EFDE|nr:DICT sensory domain-containing protein [Halorussus sp. MSC15.2]NEU56146.1 sensor protein [Halorussus sp. MSC15.2]
MGLRQFLDAVADRRKTVTVFAPDPYEGLESHFETRNVTVEHEHLPDDGSGGFVVVTAGGEFVGSVGAAAVRHLVSPSESDLELGRDGTAPTHDEATRALLDLLSDTTFASFDKRQMLLTAREIEDRAYRHGRGTLRTGFQSLSALKAQRDLYAALASESLLDVHVYGERDWSPDVPGATVHEDDADEIGAFWFVVFDGGGDERRACALLGEEIGDDSGIFRGFWTYDPETVADIDAYLRETYD